MAKRTTTPAATVPSFNGHTIETIGVAKKQAWQDSQVLYLVSRCLDITCLHESAMGNTGDKPQVVAYLAPKADDKTSWKRFSGTTQRAGVTAMIDEALKTISDIKWEGITGTDARKIMKTLAPAHATIQFYTGTVVELGLELANKSARRGEITRLHKARWSRKEVAARKVLLDAMFPGYADEVTAAIKANQPAIDKVA